MFDIITIVENQNSFELYNGTTKKNVLTWSLAGGEAVIITNIVSDKYLNELMTHFIEYVKTQRKKIISLSHYSEQYFRDSPMHIDILKKIEKI